MSGENAFGRHIERHVVRERVFDEFSGAEFANESMAETVESADGGIETLEHSDIRLLDCGHPHRPGQYVARCDGCSRNQRRPVLVCGQCAVTCPVTGESLCMRCTRPAPDGRRYSPQGHKQAERLGLFAAPRPVGAEQIPSPPCVPARRRGLIVRLLEWW